MSRVTSPEVSAFYEAEHARHGVPIVCNARDAGAGEGFRRVRRSGTVRAAYGDGWRELPRTSCSSAIGVEPVDELAARAGLECANGIVVDQHCRTSDPHIYAAGDCTSHPNIHYGGRVRLESVDNAFEQGTSAALNMLGTPTAHDKVPWFWSDQYDLKMIIVGLATGTTSRHARRSGDRAVSPCATCAAAS